MISRFSLVFLTLVSAPAQDAPDRREVRRLVEDILSSGEYDTSGPEETQDEPKSRERKRSGQGGPSEGIPIPPIFEWILYGVCIAALAAILAFVTRSLVRMRGARPKEEKAETADAPATPDEPEALLARAEAEAARGRHVEAIRFCHRAALLGMDRRRLLRFQEWLTCGDYRRSLGSHPAEGERYDVLAGVFERAYFGRTAVGDAEYRKCRLNAETLAREAAP